MKCSHLVALAHSLVITAVGVTYLSLRQSNVRWISIIQFVLLGAPSSMQSVPSGAAVSHPKCHSRLQTLDWVYYLGIAPPRFQGLKGLQQYFTMARGSDDIQLALDMSKCACAATTVKSHALNDMTSFRQLLLRSAEINSRFLHAVPHCAVGSKCMLMHQLTVRPVLLRRYFDTNYRAHCF